MNPMENHFQKLVELMDLLRSPQGCPWDREQTRETLKPMLVEEAFEVLEALDGTDSDELCEELGDLLFQVLFHSRIAKELGEFDIDDVCSRLHEKMVRRHPHVFEGRPFRDSQELLKNWEDIKVAEKEAAGRKVSRKSLLDGIPEKLPALYRTYQMSSKAARVGFDWESVEEIRDKLLEEFEELQGALQQGNAEKIKEEVGDLLFTALNISRRLQIDPESALDRANSKFSARFRTMEEHFSAQGRALKDVEMEEMEVFWNDSKTVEG